MTWIDTIVIGVVIMGALFIFYRALKEPVDMVFGWIKLGLGNLIGLIKGGGESAADKYEVITYG